MQFTAPFFYIAFRQLIFSVATVTGNAIPTVFGVMSTPFDEAFLNFSTSLAETTIITSPYLRVRTGITLGLV